MPIVYDNLGNPISYLGNTLSWEKGHQLKQFTKADGTIISYTYNANGIRTSKTVGGVKHTYALDGARILKETWGDCTLIPLYDNEDSVCGIMYDDAAYYFHKNLQGDVIEIKNAYGVLVARYTYDAWGRVVAITDSNGFDVSNNAAHVANANPFRYRGYYYDAEIGMYYLQSRYYDSVIGRYINPDTVSMVFENETNSNLYWYCCNDAVNKLDEYGLSPFGVHLKHVAYGIWTIIKLCALGEKALKIGNRIVFKAASISIKVFSASGRFEAALMALFAIIGMIIRLAISLVVFAYLYQWLLYTLQELRYSVPWHKHKGDDMVMPPKLTPLSDRFYDWLGE